MSAAKLPPAPPPDDSAWRHPAHIAFESLVARGPVLVAVSPFVPGALPEGYCRAGQPVALRLGYGLVPAIADLAWDAAQITATLSFSGQPFTCRIPWFAVLALRSDGALPASNPPEKRNARPTLKLV